MSNPIFLVGALAENTYTMSEAEDASYPLSNLQTYIPADVVRFPTSTGNKWIKINRGAALPTDFIVIDTHNIENMVVAYLQYDAADNPNFTNPITLLTLTGVSTDPYYASFASVTKRYFRIYFNANGYNLSVGQIFLNKKFDPGQTFVWPYKAKNEDFNVSMRRSASGLMRTARNYDGILRFEVKFAQMNDTFESNWLRFHQKVYGSSCPFYYRHTDDTMYLMHLSQASNPIEKFRYQLNNSGSILMESQGVGQNPLT